MVSPIVYSGLTNTSQSLGPVAVPNADHQWKEVDITKASCCPLCQASSAAGGDGDGAQTAANGQTPVSITQEPLWAGLPPL